MTSLELLLHCANSAATHMRGRDTDEQTLKRIEALFFEVYTGPDSVPNGYKEVDNALYATSLATVPQHMLKLSCCAHAFPVCAASPRSSCCSSTTSKHIQSPSLSAAVCVGRC